MKLKKMTSLLLLSGIVLSVGGTTLTNSTSAAAATIVSESKYEKVISFTKEDLANATGVTLNTTEKAINNMYNALKKASVWESLGYDSTQAQRIASRISQSMYQTIGILTSIANHQQLQFKVVTINKPNYSGVNIGTIGTDDATEEPDKGDNTGNADDSAFSKQVKDVEIKMEYKKGKIELEYEVKSNGTIKAEVENKLTGMKLKGSVAQTYIEELFVDLDTKTSSQNEIAEHVMKYLKTDQKGLKKFDFKVKYADKTKVDFKIKY
ncbi:YusW family protein [Enterococcus ratti]|uniref:Uncharacterized protein n=1 Tax=Enterococcus ratti TaxID=150033 RepID=A0A1L8WSE3_9ENTE|nr:YusW family protein [Enterococcus ratti]OJG83920.1 hypothetical protein RV14_GL000097 [Enterococcus ratti]